MTAAPRLFPFIIRSVRIIAHHIQICTSKKRAPTKAFLKFQIRHDKELCHHHDITIEKRSQSSRSDKLVKLVISGNPTHHIHKHTIINQTRNRTKSGIIPKQSLHNMYTDSQTTSNSTTEAASRCQSPIAMDHLPPESPQKSEILTLSPKCVMSERDDNVFDSDRSGLYTIYESMAGCAPLPDLDHDEQDQEPHLPKLEQKSHNTLIDADAHDNATTGKKRVRFVPSLVTHVHIWPRTETRDWQHFLYYSSHELQKIIMDERKGLNSLPIRQKRCIIVAEEEDLDV